NDNRVVLVSTSCSNAILIVDLGASTLEFVGYLNRHTYCSDYYHKCLGVSADTTKIRYILLADRDEDGRFLDPLTIVESDAAEGKERTIYIHEPDMGEPFVGCHPDLLGERWLCKTQGQVGDAVFTKYRMIMLDGQVQ